MFLRRPNFFAWFQNNGAQQLASEATIFIVLEDVNDEIPLFTEREQERVLEGEPIGTIVTRVNAIDKDGTFPNNQVKKFWHEKNPEYSNDPDSDRSSTRNIQKLAFFVWHKIAETRLCRFTSEYWIFLVQYFNGDSNTGLVFKCDFNTQTY